MNQLIRFLFKEKIYFLLICVIGSFFAIKYGGVWNIVPYIFLLFFFYDWNVSSKINKTWLYIETLPISLFKRFILRVIFPFIFCFIILYCLEVLKRTGEIDVIKSMTDALRQTSIFVLSSILASSLGGYVFFIVAFNIVIASLSFSPFYIISILIFTFSYTYYLLSKKRLSKVKFVYAPLLICILILSFGTFFQKWHNERFPNYFDSHEEFKQENSVEIFRMYDTLKTNVF